MVKRIVASWLLLALALGPPVSLEAQATADAELEKGVLQVQSGDFEAALITLDGAVRRLAGQRGATGDLARTHVYLGMAYLGLDQEKAARERFQDAWRVDNGMKPSASEFPPRVLRLLEEARKEVLSPSAAKTTPEPQASPQPTAKGGADSSATAPKKGGSKLPLVLVGVAAVGGGVALAASKKTDPRDADADKDGFSINQGDCNDSDPQIKPNAGFSFTVDLVFTGTISCAQRNTRPQTYRIQNNSCAALTVQSLRAAAGGVGSCTFPQETRDLTLSATTVGAGSSATVRTAAGANTAAALCCSSPPCTIGNCTISEQYTATTSAGAQTVTNSFVVTDPTGRTCSACSDVVNARSNGTGNAQCTSAADHR